MPTAFPQIPYGWAHFEAMRLERCLYVDKTRFLHELEKPIYLKAMDLECLRPQQRGTHFAKHNSCVWRTVFVQIQRCVAHVHFSFLPRRLYYHFCRRERHPYGRYEADGG